MIKSLDIFTADILIVDDQDANITLLQHMLGGAGYVSISSTKNPLEVCALHQKNRYSLIILDLQMPGMDGFQVMDGLKAIENDGYLPVLVITAQPGHKLRALKAGARDFVSKPIDLAEVLMRVHNILEVRLLHLETKKLYAQVLEEEKISEQLMLIFRSCPGCVSISTVAGGRMIDANEEYCKFFSCSREEMVGGGVTDLDLWAEPKDRTEVMQRLLQEGAIRGLELKKRRKSGEVRDVLASLEMIKMIGEPEPVAILMFADITERKAAETDLRISEARYRTLFNTMDEGFCIVQMIFDADEKPVDYRYLEVNPSFEKHSGLHDAVGKTVSELIPGMEKHWFDVFGKVALTGESVRFINEAKVLDRWFDVCSFQISNPADRKVAILFTNITERKRAEEALRESEVRFRQLAENIHEVFWLTDPIKGEKLYVSPAYEKIWGRTCASLYSAPHSWLESIHPEDRERMRAASPKKLDGTYDEEYRVVRPDGSVRWIRDRAFPVRNADGVISRIVGVARDTTDQRQLEGQLRQSQKMDAIGQLAGGIAHDFNNILGAIMGYTELAKLDTVANPDVQEYLQEVSVASRRAVDLVKQILMFSRQQEMTRKSVSLKPILLEALKLLRAAAPATIDIQTKLADVPTVLADASSIHQIVMNLGTNGCYAMKGRTGVLKVELSEIEVDDDFVKTHLELKPGHYVKVAVSDTGAGMDHGTVLRIFEPFFTTKPAGEGTGLGLAVVHGIMKSHDGGINVYSHLGQGTTFQLYFPVFGVEAFPISTNQSPIPFGHGERILFVDDEEALASFGKRILERLGYAVTIKISVTEALKDFQAAPGYFDMVITDLTMPIMDGITFARALLEIKPHLAIILTTGYSGTTTTETAREMGFRDLLIKPYTARSLGETVHTVFEQETHFLEKSGRKRDKG